MNRDHAVVDLFAGPGGLGEGFSEYVARDGTRPFRIALSVENHPAAHATLTLRSFLRQFPNGFPDEYYEFLSSQAPEPDWAELYPRQWEVAQHEALCATLGEPEARRLIRERIQELRRTHGGRTILIGGPPCQAYSVAGRVRNAAVSSYVPENDRRHFLYREYIDILKCLEPAAFVMENVKGLLSSSVKGAKVFERVLEDLGHVGGKGKYVLVPLAATGTVSGFEEVTRPTDFIVEAERFGVPQSRHRVIIVGVRRDAVDLAQLRRAIRLPESEDTATVADVLTGMPRLRSGLSREQDSSDAWAAAVKHAHSLIKVTETRLGPDLRRELQRCVGSALQRVVDSPELPRAAAGPAGFGGQCPPALRKFIEDRRLQRLTNNETRAHMAPDLARYMFASAYAEVVGQSPKMADFPEGLAPNHENWKSGAFVDRFRVQVSNEPSSTVTSHISKDGHYFIHPDPSQCRSLTVREAARLQTFPDNYFFKGNRTEQYVQVGNAVPPFLARQIAEAISKVLSLDGRVSASVRPQDEQRRAVTAGAA